MPLVKYKYGQSDVEYIVYGTQIIDGATWLLIDLYDTNMNTPFKWVLMRDCVPYYE